MRADLERFHGIAPERVVVAGWPLTDVFARRRQRDLFERVVRKLGLDPARPVVLYAGNTAVNSPYESGFLDRLVAWRDAQPDVDWQLVVRPHPNDAAWETRFGHLRARPGISVQAPSYSDLEALATLLQHVGCVVGNGGTMLLEAIVNDRPAVCVVYDEGAPAGESWAAKNVVGRHYRALIESPALLRAPTFEGALAAIERSLAAPGELSAERAGVTGSIVGTIDGGVAGRVVDAVADTIERAVQPQQTARSDR